ncbi:MAG: PfkB family carbohydrate kinase [Verrucomicrobiae bacterium]|nr:PfkB family carbohydrate kinase [Verrucomicrobiae bacterium]
MPQNPKIKELDDLAALVQKLKAEGKKVVHCHGVFDLLHIGHIRYFEQARKMGDVLAVTITRDEHVNKGPGRPVFAQDLRAEAIAALSVVDYVAVNRWPTAVETIKLLRPDFYVKGPDYKEVSKDVTGGIVAEREAVKSVGGEIRFTEDVTFSSSSLLNRFFAGWSPEVEKFIAGFCQRHSPDEVLEWLERAAALRPLVVGEAIIDEYVFCQAIGKSSKDPVLAVLQGHVETYAGGTLAIANHLSGLCEEVQLVTQLGGAERREDFVRSALRPNVRPVFLTKSSSPTIHKRRLVDQYTGNKLFEIYVMDDRQTGSDDMALLSEALQKAFKEADLTMVADYGHGMLSPQLIELLCESAPFLCVNVQTNAGNRGFNSISKYRRADYVCLNAGEVEMETRRRNENIKPSVEEMSKRVKCARFTVTRGKQGICHYDTDQGTTEIPALASRVADRVGAGDAVLAVTSLLVKLGAPWDIVGFLGNLAGAQLVAELGNRKPLDRVALSKHVTAIMK